MTKTHLVTMASLLLATMSLLAPAGQAEAPKQAEETAGTLGSCGFIIVTGSAACIFSCVRERRVSVSFIGIGSVKGVCTGGAAAACATIGSCTATSLVANAANGQGVCILSGTGSGSCSG